MQDLSKTRLDDSSHDHDSGRDRITDEHLEVAMSSRHNLTNP